MSLRHAILGFLDLEPTTGYVLMKRFKGSVGSFWTATQSQIYRELHALAEEGWVRVKTVPQDGKPARKVYALTKLGQLELRHWLEEPSEPVQLRDPLQLKLVFAAELAEPQVDALLAKHADSLQKRRSEYTARLRSPAIFSMARSERERVLWQLSIESGIAWCDWQIEWVKKARNKLAHVKTRNKSRKKVVT